MPGVAPSLPTDTAVACSEQGLETVAVTAGYVHPQPRRDLFAVMSAANVDLKGFSDEFYLRQTGAHLRPVLDTLVYLREATTVWLELTTLLIPGFNDSDAELRAMCRWAVTELGPDVPHHFTAFHPDHRMPDVERTPGQTLLRARDIALESGELFAYTGNGGLPAGDTTNCPGCGRAVSEREGYTLRAERRDKDGGCLTCATNIAGRVEPKTGR